MGEIYTTVVALPSGQLVAIHREITYGDLVLAGVLLFIAALRVGEALYQWVRRVV